MSFFQRVLPRIVLNINPLDSDSHSDYRALSLSVLYTCHCLKLLKHIFLFFLFWEKNRDIKHLSKYLRRCVKQIHHQKRFPNIK